MGALAGLKNLTSLRLSQRSLVTSLTVLPDLPRLVSLAALFIDGHYALGDFFSNLTWDSLQPMSKLRTLSAARLPFRNGELPVALQQISSLAALTVSSCNLTTFPFLGNLTALTTLTLTNNNIAAVPGDVRGQSSKLTSLAMTGNPSVCYVVYNNVTGPAVFCSCKSQMYSGPHSAFCEENCPLFRDSNLQSQMQNCSLSPRAVGRQCHFVCKTMLTTAMPMPLRCESNGSALAWSLNNTIFLPSSTVCVPDICQSCSCDAANKAFSCVGRNFTAAGAFVNPPSWAVAVDYSNTQMSSLPRFNVRFFLVCLSRGLKLTQTTPLSPSHC